MTIVFKISKAFLLIGYAFLLLIHFVIKDHIFILSEFFYAFPLPIIIVISLFLCIIFRKVKTVLFSLLFITSILIFVWINNYYLINTSDKKDASSVLFWNVARNKPFPIDIISKNMDEFHPEIIGLVEADNITIQDTANLKKQFPDYAFKVLEGNMFVGIKGQIKSIYYQSKNNSYKFNHITALINNKSIPILLVDINAAMFLDRETPLNTVKKYAIEHDIAFIIGDFNTPYESVLFKDYYLNYQNLHQYTNGFTATWPYGIPLLELDQIFMSKNMKPICLEKINFNVSDHQLLIGSYKN